MTLASPSPSPGGSKDFLPFDGGFLARRGWSGWGGLPIIHLGEGPARKGPPATPALCRALGNEALILHPLYVSEARCQGGDLIKRQRGARFPTSLWDTYVQAFSNCPKLEAEFTSVYICNVCSCRSARPEQAQAFPTSPFPQAKEHFCE